MKTEIKGTKFTAAIAARITEDEPPRIVHNSELWDSMDLQVCIHGEALRHRCDQCAEFLQMATALKGVLGL